MNMLLVSSSSLYWLLTGDRDDVMDKVVDEDDDGLNGDCESCEYPDDEEGVGMSFC